MKRAALAMVLTTGLALGVGVAPRQSFNPILVVRSGDRSALHTTGWTLKVRLLPNQAELEEDFEVTSSTSQTVVWRAEPPVGTFTVNGLAASTDELQANFEAGHMSAHIHCHSTVDTTYQLRPGSDVLEGWLFTVRSPGTGVQSGSVQVRDDSGYQLDGSSSGWQHIGSQYLYDATRPLARADFSTVVLTGILQPVGMSIQMQGTHQLLTPDGKVIALLDAADKSVDLQADVGKTVHVAGDLGHTVEGGIRFMHVRKVVPAQ